MLSLLYRQSTSDTRINNRCHIQIQPTVIHTHIQTKIAHIFTQNGRVTICPGELEEARNMIPDRELIKSQGQDKKFLFRALVLSTSKDDQCLCTGWATLLLSISLPIIDRFSKFFHWHTLQTICNNVIITYPTTW